MLLYRPSGLRPACDPPLQAGFVFLGSRLLANQLAHPAPAWARSQFGRGLSGKGAKQVELRTDGAIREHASNSLEVFQGRQVDDDGLVVRVLAGAGEGTSVVQHLPALPIEHIAFDLRVLGLHRWATFLTDEGRQGGWPWGFGASAAEARSRS